MAKQIKRCPACGRNFKGFPETRFCSKCSKINTSGKT